MDKLEEENNKLLVDLKECRELIKLLLKYKLYLTDYLKVCKCKQSDDQFSIRHKTEELEEEFQRFTSFNLDNNILKPKSDFSEDNNEENESTNIDNNCKQNSLVFEEQISPDLKTTNSVYFCEEKGCDQCFHSKQLFEKHSNVCPKRVKLYICSECETTFKDVVTLKRHLLAHKRVSAQNSVGNCNQSFVCPEVGCNKVFDTKLSVSVHMSKLHKSCIKGKKNYICNWIGCGQKTSSRQDLELHIKRKHTLEKPFKCDKCDKRYELEKLLRSHQKIHSNVRHVCDFEGCEYKTPNIWELKTHIKNKHLNEERYECDFEGCHRNYKYISDLQVHKRRTHIEVKTFVCEWPGCQSEFARQDCLNNHMARHKNERQFKCEANGCEKAFNTKKELNMHLKLHTGDMYTIPCEWPGCSKMVASRFHLNTHINSFHLKLKPFSCDLCEKTFSQKENLVKHKQSSHSGVSSQLKGKFECEECLRFFISKKVLENHKKSVHSSEASFVCDWPQCRQRFKTSNALTAHKSIHSEEGEFKCCAINCGKSFTARQALLSHEKIHNKKFECHWPGCAKKFVRNCVLVEHIRRHENIREFKCCVDGCGKSFVTKTHLDDHLDKHSNPFPFKCIVDGCERSFSRKKLLQNHVDRFHLANNNKD